MADFLRDGATGSAASCAAAAAAQLVTESERAEVAETNDGWNHGNTGGRAGRIHMEAPHFARCPPLCLCSPLCCPLCCPLCSPLCSPPRDTRLAPTYADACPPHQKFTHPLQPLKTKRTSAPPRVTIRRQAQWRGANPSHEGVDPTCRALVLSPLGLGTHPSRAFPKIHTQFNTPSPERTSSKKRRTADSNSDDARTPPGLVRTPTSSSK